MLFACFIGDWFVCERVRGEETNANVAFDPKSTIEEDVTRSSARYFQAMAAGSAIISK